MDWRSLGAANPHIGKQTIRTALEAAGLTIDTPDYQQAFEAVRQGQADEVQRRAAEQAAAAAARLAPWIEHVRGEAPHWGCAGEVTDEVLEAMILEEAARLADEADERAEEEARAAEREAAEAADYAARQEALVACVAAVKAMVADAGWRIEERRCSHEQSRYYWLKSGGEADDPGDYDQVLSLRISDHHAKGGAGWNEEKQERHDEPQVNIVLRMGDGGAYTFDLSSLDERL